MPLWGPDRAAGSLDQQLLPVGIVGRRPQLPCVQGNPLHATLRSRLQQLAHLGMRPSSLEQSRHATEHAGFHEKFIIMKGTEADRTSSLRRNTKV